MPLAVSDEAIRRVIRDEWQDRRFAWSPEGAATLAALPELADRGMIRQGDRVVLVNTASAEKYLPTIRDLFDGGALRSMFETSSAFKSRSWDGRNPNSLGPQQPDEGRGRPPRVAGFGPAAAGGRRPGPGGDPRPRAERPGPRRPRLGSPRRERGGRRCQA